MSKKNLDKLFQEKFKDFSDRPDESVWPSIEASLNKKKKSRKILPIWWRLGGVAAVLAIAVFLINPFEEIQPTNTTVTTVNEATEKTSEEKISIKEAPKNVEKLDAKETQIADSESRTNETNLNSVTTSDTSIDEAVKDSNMTHPYIKSKADITTSPNTVIVHSNSNKDQIISHDPDSYTMKEEKEISKTATAKNDLSSKNEAIANSSSPQKKQPLVENAVKEKNTIIAAQNAIVKNNVENSKTEKIAQLEKETADETSENSKKKSIFDVIAAQEEEKEVLAENAVGRWSAGPTIAPVYYDAIGEGSPVHSIFVPNSKSGDLNLSYGLSVAYEVSKKLSIRSGVHKVDYGYRTNDVEFASTLDGSTNAQIAHIDLAISARNLAIGSKAGNITVNLNQNPFLSSASADVSTAGVARDGVILQQFGYIEVPVELNYALIDRKFGVNLIGGISSLFLVDNSVSLTSGELSTQLGEANNVNSVNFSTNVGLGMNYKFTPKVQLNIAPVFKYQLNTFSETDGVFNPFSVGVYSGLSFKF